MLPCRVQTLQLLDRSEKGGEDVVSCERVSVGVVEGEDTSEGEAATPPLNLLQISLNDGTETGIPTQSHPKMQS